MLAACGGSAVDGRVVVQRFPDTILVPGNVRLPISLAEANGTLLSGGPASLNATLLDQNSVVVATLTATRRDLGKATTSFWVFRTDIAAPGIYELVVENLEPAALQVLQSNQVAVPQIGTTLPGFDTPTVDNHRGVEPYCSRVEGPCPLHDVTLTQALASGLPVVYIVGTPGHCQTASCGPGLEFVVAAAIRVGPKAVFVHADVYADDAATILAPAVDALQLTYEPVVFFVDKTGTIVERLDAVWDQAEVDAAVSLIV